jgi:hypothetical protein
MIKVLLRASVEAVEIFANRDKSAPKVHAYPPAVGGERVVKTRHHWVEFATGEAAKRFKGLIFLSHEMHELRRSMKHAEHPSTRDVYRVRVSVNDWRGSLQVRSHDAMLEDLLGTTWASPDVGEVPSSTLASALEWDGFESGFEDPLVGLGDLEQPVEERE